jgi:hypothetical protein
VISYEGGVSRAEDVTERAAIKRYLVGIEMQEEMKIRSKQMS